MNACPTSHQNLSQEPVSIAFPCHSSVHHMNISVTGSPSVNLVAPVMTAVLPSSLPPLIQALPQKPVPSLQPLLLEISEFVAIADRSTLNQPCLHTTYVCSTQCGSHLVQWMTIKTRFGNVYFHCNLPCCFATLPQVWLFSSYLHILSSSEDKCQDDCNCHLY